MNPFKKIFRSIVRLFNPTYGNVVTHRFPSISRETKKAADRPREKYLVKPRVTSGRKD